MQIRFLKIKSRKMKKTKYILIVSLISAQLFSGCKKYLDINSDPDTPQTPDPSSVFPAMLSGIPRGVQFDARYIGKYIQNFVTSSTSRAESERNWDIHGHFNYPNISDIGGDIWRQTYYGLGANLNYIIDQGIRNEQWDHVGAGYALKAYIFQSCADVYGQIIYTDAFKENTSVFRFDDQELVYKGVDSLAKLALHYLSRAEQPSTAQPLSKGDFVYNGDKSKWLKFANGILARNFHRAANKTSGYQADSAIYYAERAMKSVNDDFVIPFDATKNDDSNFFGTYRDNLTFFRQSNFIVQLLDGTILAGARNVANRDPRIRHLLSVSADSVYRGLDPGAASAGSGRTQVPVLWGDSLTINPSATRFDPTRGKYLFRDKVVFPIMTYSEILFLIAEAQFIKKNNGAAFTAYQDGIKAHFDFINRATFPRGNNPLFNVTTISTAERNAYMASANVKQTAATLTISDIMLQKYIAQWAWNFVESWVDLRRYNYLEVDPATNKKVFNGYFDPTGILPATNNGKLAMRIRPRYNSEYVWNRPELERIGATNPDYHTYPMWFSIK